MCSNSQSINPDDAHKTMPIINDLINKKKLTMNPVIIIYYLNSINETT